MPIYRARVVTDLVYEAEDQLSPGQLRTLCRITDTYLHIAAVDEVGSEDGEIKALLDPEQRHYTAHHHDGESGCRTCRNMSSDELTHG